MIPIRQCAQLPHLPPAAPAQPPAFPNINRLGQFFCGLEDQGVPGSEYFINEADRQGLLAGPAAVALLRQAKQRYEHVGVIDNALRDVLPACIRGGLAAAAVAHLGGVVLPALFLTVAEAGERCQRAWQVLMLQQGGPASLQSAEQAERDCAALTAACVPLRERLTEERVHAGLQAVVTYAYGSGCTVEHFAAGPAGGSQFRQACQESVANKCVAFMKQHGAALLGELLRSLLAPAPADLRRLMKDGLAPGVGAAAELKPATAWAYADLAALMQATVTAMQGPVSALLDQPCFQALQSGLCVLIGAVLPLDPASEAEAMEGSAEVSQRAILQFVAHRASSILAQLSDMQAAAEARQARTEASLASMQAAAEANQARLMSKMAEDKAELVGLITSLTQGVQALVAERDARAAEAVLAKAREAPAVAARMSSPAPRQGWGGGEWGEDGERMWRTAAPAGGGRRLAVDTSRAHIKQF